MSVANSIGGETLSPYVQYGCAWCAPAGWTNFDASPTLRFERLPIIGSLYTKNENRFPGNVEYGDIVKGLPVPDDSCKGIYCSHVLEHLSLSDFRVALRKTYQILETGGVFRLVVPDLEYLAKNYVNSLSVDASYEFMQNTGLAACLASTIKNIVKPNLLQLQCGIITLVNQQVEHIP